MESLEQHRMPSYQWGSRWFAMPDGHYYIACRTRGTSTKLRCATVHCTAAILVKADGRRTTPVHHHVPEHWLPERNMMFEALRRAVIESPDLNLNTIYERIAARYPDYGAPRLPYEQVEGSMRRWRRETQPRVPDHLGEYAQALQNHHRYQPRFLGLVEAAGARAVLLGMDGFAACLQQAEVVLFDATFDTAPLHPQIAANGGDEPVAAAGPSGLRPSIPPPSSGLRNSTPPPRRAECCVCFEAAEVVLKCGLSQNAEEYGHLACLACTSRVELCPVCRSEFTGYMALFY